MTATVLLVALALGQAPPEKAATEAEKQEFFKLLAKLPTRGEFFTEEAVTKAVPYTRVLLALTEKDLEKRDLYPLFALSSGLARRKESRQYAVANFGRIAHPQLKLGWAVLLFNGNATSPEVLTFLHAALRSEKGARWISDATGPGFEDFRQRVTQAYETGRRSKVELVKRHTIKALPDYGHGHSYTNASYVFAPGQLLYAVRPHNQQGELIRYDLVKGDVSRLVVPQPKGFKAELKVGTYFDNPALSVNGRGDLFCRWAIEGNGDHGLALLTKGANAFLVKRARLYLANSLAVAGPDGAWYLIEGGPNFTVHRVDEGLNLTRLGNFAGRGHHTVDIANARFISNEVLHLFWADVLTDNHLRMRCVDFDVKRRKWLHAREIFRLEKFVSSADGPTVLQLEDGSVHYLWKVDEGAKRGEATGLYYQAEADGRTVKIASGYDHRAAAAGDRIVVCYTSEGAPEQVSFRVINHGIAGPVTSVPANKGRKDSLSSEYMQLYAEAGRIWFANTLTKDTLYELRLADAPAPPKAAGE